MYLAKFCTYTGLLSYWVNFHCCKGQKFNYNIGSHLFTLQLLGKLNANFAKIFLIALATGSLFSNLTRMITNSINFFLRNKIFRQNLRSTLVLPFPGMQPPIGERRFLIRSLPLHPSGLQQQLKLNLDQLCAQVCSTEGYHIPPIISFPVLPGILESFLIPILGALSYSSSPIIA